jgi:pilus assembly protein CpaE
MASRTILLAGVRPTTEARLRAALQDTDFVPLLANGVPPVRDAGSAAAVVNLDGDPERGFRLVRELSGAGVRVVVLGPAKDPDLILRAMHEGAKEFVLASDEDALARALHDHPKPARVADGGRIYAVFPAKGGVGATTIATNLAGALQRLGERTCLVDLDLDMGDVLAFLDLRGGYSLSDVVANMRRLDRELLDSTLVRHASGVHVLAQSHRVEEADRIEPTALGGVLRFLAQHYRAVVVDGLRTFDDLAVAAIDASDTVTLVVTEEVPAVRNARRCADLFRRLHAEDRLKLVVNRHQKGVEITPAVVAETVGLPVAATIPSDYPAVVAAMNRGGLLLDEAPRSAVTKGIEGLVEVLGHPRAGVVGGERPSLLKRFFNGRA